MQDETRSTEDESKRDTARSAASDAAAAGKEKAHSLFLEQRMAAADRIHDIADALRTTARDLDGDDHGTTSRFTAAAAEGVDSFASTLRERDLESLLHDAERFARRSPVLFLSGAVTAGFLLGRFLRSSAERPPEPERSRTYSGDEDRGSGELEPAPRRTPAAAPRTTTPPTTL